MPGIVPADDLPQAAPQAAAPQGNVVPESDLPTGPQRPVSGVLDAIKAGATPAEAIAGSEPIRFAAGAAKPFLGLASMGAHAAGSLIQKLGGKYPDFVNALDQHIMDYMNLEKAGQQFYGGGANVAGLAGEMLSPMGLGAAKAIPEAAEAASKGMKLLRNMGQGAAISGVYGATTPPTEVNPQDYWGQRVSGAIGGAAAGAVLPPVASLLKMPVSALYHTIEPWLPGGAKAIEARTIGAIVGNKAQDVANAIENYKALPGETPTAGEAAAAAGSAEFSGLQKILEGVQPSPYFAQHVVSNKALSDVIGLPDEGQKAVQAAIDQRKAIGRPLYQALENKVVTADPTLQDLLGRPSMNKAFDRAEDIAKDRGLSFIKQAGQPAQQVPSRILGENGQPAFVQSIPATATQYPLGSLQSVKMALDDMVKNPERFGIGAQEAGGIQGIRDDLSTWMRAKVPEYDKAASEWARLSRPINQAEILTQLSGALNPALNDFGATAQARANAYAAAVRNAPQTIKRATGQTRYSDLGQILEPEQQAAVQQVGDVLANRNKYEQLASLGKAQASKILGVTEKPHLPLPHILERSVVIANTLINRLQGKVNEQMLQELATRLRDPREVVNLLRAMPDARRAALLREASRTMRTGASAGVGIGMGRASQ